MTAVFYKMSAFPLSDTLKKHDLKSQNFLLLHTNLSGQDVKSLCFIHFLFTGNITNAHSNL